MKKFYSKLGKILLGFYEKKISLTALKKVIEGKLDVKDLAFFHDNLKTEDDLFFDMSDLFCSIKKFGLKISDLEDILKKSKMPTIVLDLSVSRKERLKSYTFIFPEAGNDEFSPKDDDAGKFETMLIKTSNISEDLFNKLQKDRWFSPSIDHITEFCNKFSNLLRKYEILSFSIENDKSLMVWSYENSKKIVFVTRKNKKNDLALFLRRIN